VKGCLPRPGLECKEEAVLDWYNDLFKGVPERPDTNVADRIRYYVRKAIGKNVCEVNAIYREVHCPSTSANYVYNRDDGGCVTAILDKFNLENIPLPTL
jgi:hypothetical protein